MKKRFISILLTYSLLLFLTSAQPFDSDHHFSLARIVGGKEIEIEEAPWQVSLQTCYSSDNSSRCSHNCGGFIISEKWIMTAGHCVMSGRKMRVRLGTKNNNDGGSWVNITRMVRHKMYNERTIDFDYGLFELSEALSFTNKVKAIVLPSEKDTLPDGTLCVLTGWGLTHNSSEPINILRKLTHPIMNRKECADDVQNIIKLTPRMLCAGPKGDSKSGCFGDSGGALTCEVKDGTRKVFGIASWVTGSCLGPDNRTVYARVQAARKWIKLVSGV